MSIIDAEASEAAKAFFMRLGFEERQRRNLNLGGVAIHNYAMRKKLTR
jgi:putative acetyltransferase